MSDITNVRFNNTLETSVYILPHNVVSPYPIMMAGLAQDVEEWLAEGNAVTPYDPYRGMTEAQAYAVKEASIDTYGDGLIDAAYASPAQGVTYNANRYKKVVNRRKSNRSDKMAGDIALSEAEKEESKMDEKLSEYETKITKDQDKAFTNLYKLSGVDNIMAFDVTEENWSTWASPV